MEIKVEINYLVFQLLAVVIYDPLEGRGNKALHDVILYFRLLFCTVLRSRTGRIQTFLVRSGSDSDQIVRIRPKNVIKQEINPQS